MVQFEHGSGCRGIANEETGHKSAIVNLMQKALSVSRRQ